MQNTQDETASVTSAPSRDYDPLNSPRFGEWVRVDNYVAPLEEEDRPTVPRASFSEAQRLGTRDFGMSRVFRSGIGQRRWVLPAMLLIVIAGVFAFSRVEKVVRKPLQPKAPSVKTPDAVIPSTPSQPVKPESLRRGEARSTPTKASRKTGSIASKPSPKPTSSTRTARGTNENVTKTFSSNAGNRAQRSRVTKINKKRESSKRLLRQTGKDSGHE